MKIRGAKESDIVRLVDYGFLFWQSTRYAQVDGREYSYTTVEDLLLRLINDPDYGFCLVVADDNDEAVGFALVATYPFIFNPDFKAAGELAFYIDEQYRGKKIAVQLLQTMEKTAKDRGCKYMAMISMEHSMDVGPLYEKLGYIKTETTYTKEL